jgi:tetratricopeptide (TPR) repeat protein
MRKPSIIAVAPALAFLVLLAAAWLAYRPGLGGGFVFDDFGTLPALGATGKVDNAAAFWRYVTAGSGDPTGRPVAMLSFLIDANDWPANPYPFKRTAILLHLLNGALLTWFLVRLGRAMGVPDAQGEPAAVIGAALWLLHPLLVSTTLYVVQREAMLPATFTLIGLLGYLVGRTRARQGHRGGAWLAGFSIAACTVLAFLSKANGLLLPLLAWIVEAIALAPRAPVRDGPAARDFRLVRALVLALPTAIVLAYLAKSAWTGFVDGVDDIRPWTLGERLLTEARVLSSYIGLLWIPRAYTTGLFNDAYVASTGFLSPATTLPAILFVGTLIGAAIAIRRRHPALALAILFYFGGQLMESSVIALELYFEHRNYVPALLMFWPLGLWLCGARIPGTSPAREPATANSRVLRTALALVIPLAFAVLTYMRADLWGKPQDQALIWALKNPDSPRAQAYAAQIEMSHGNNAAAAVRLERALAAQPEEIQLALNLIGARCATGGVSRDDLAHAEHALREAPNTGRLGYDWFDRGLPTALAGTCPGFDLASVSELLEAASENKRTLNIPGRRQDILHLKGRVALLRHDDERALELFDEAFAADPRPGAALDQAAVLATAGKPELALRHLDYMETIAHPPSKPNFSMASLHEWLLWRQGYWPHEIAHLRATLAEDIARKTESHEDSTHDAATSG